MSNVVPFNTFHEVQHNYIDHKNIKSIILLFFFTMMFSYQSMARLAVDTAKINTATVAKMKKEINSMIADSEKEFAHNQGSVTPVRPILEDKDNKAKYYQSATRYKGEVSMVRVEERNSVIYKTLIFGWRLNKNTPEDVKQEVKNMRRATMEFINEKVKTGAFRSFKVKSIDSSARTELRDTLGNRILEIADRESYFHLIIFGKTWRTDPVDGLLADFTINSVIELQNKTRRFKSAYPFALIGTKNNVSLYATSLGNDVIFAIDNLSQTNVRVKIKLLFECTERKTDKETEREETVHTIMVEGNSQVTYNNKPESSIAHGCKRRSNNWVISDWSVE